MTKKLQLPQWIARFLIGLLAAGSPAFAGDDLIGLDGNTGQYTGFTNQGSIVNTRHNLTQSTLAGLMGGAVNMQPSRNNYGEVCVYCHTPHGANANSSVPLWNRAIPATTYQTYNQLGTVTAEQSYSQPGAASLPCLSCHDGQQAVDAIINMPGSGRYNANPSSAAGSGGDLWTRWNVAGQRSLNHGALRAGNTGQECLSCHSNPGSSASAVDFTVFAIGTDLRNDHPIGVTFPTTTGPATDWNTPGGTRIGGGFTSKFFDDSGDGKMQKGEIRLYNTGQGPEVECGSCHDPHGVPSAGANSPFFPTFLRKSNAASAVCLTCHAK
jgi:hypothetical protein